MSNKNKVFHLKVEVHSTRFGKLKEKNSQYSELFFSHREAWEAGKEHLQRAVQMLYEESDYSVKTECLPKELNWEPNEPSIEAFLNDDQVYYSWMIWEIDLDRMQNCEWPKSDRYRLYPPAHISYSYSLDGELRHRDYWWLGSGVNICIQKHEGDDLPEAGTKFQLGDFVRLKRPLKAGQRSFGTDEVFVITGVPVMDSDGYLNENKYNIETVLEWGEYLWDLDFGWPFSGIHESELVKYDGEIKDDSPLVFLRRVFCGEGEQMREVVRKLERSEILLTPCISWGDIPEFAVLAEEEDKNR